MATKRQSQKPRPRKRILPAARLQLHRFWLQELSYSLTNGPIGEMAEDIPLAGESEVSELDDGYLVRLTLRARQTKRPRSPFKFKMVLSGHFGLRGEADEAGQRLAYVNGSAMLYSIARGIISMITGIGEATVRLPMINFAAFLEKDADA